VLTFTFNPQVGDTAGPPALYRFKLDTTFGDSGTATQNIRDIHVAGRCGLNSPFADAILSPPTTPVGTAIAIDATSSSDKDNDPLTFFAGPPSTSAGCGLNQTLTFHWTVTTAPATSASVVTPNNSATARFTPDFPGNYTLQLDVTDNTPSPAANLSGHFTTTITAN
jgi:hypothetical protein